VTKITAYYYVVKHPDGFFEIDLINKYKSQAIGSFIKEIAESNSWREAYKEGFRCVKVKVTEC